MYLIEVSFHVSSDEDSHFLCTGKAAYLAADNYTENGRSFKFYFFPIFTYCTILKILLWAREKVHVPKIKTKAREKVYVHSSESEMENRRQKVNDSH